MRILLTILLIATRLCCANGQAYLNETARWTQSYSWTGFTANSNCTTVYYIEGDSIINDTSYFKVFSDVVCYFNQTEYDSLGNPYVVSDTSTSISLAMLLREESGKFLRRFGNQEAMLYDFAVNDFTGIAFAVQNPLCGTGNPSLMTHDTICIGNISRKRWLISPSQYPLANYFIEGVGPSSGFNAPICRNGCPECNYSLNSFELNGDTMYHGNCLVLGSAYRPEELVSFMQSGEIIQFHSTTLQHVELFTLQGAHVGIFNAKQGQVSISLAQFQTGIYVYKALDAGKSTQGKFIVSH